MTYIAAKNTIQGAIATIQTKSTLKRKPTVAITVKYNSI